MSKWIAEFDLEDGDTMPEHMDLTYNGAKLDFHCTPLNEVEAEEHYCDRNICMQNEYNGIGCKECEITKSHKSISVKLNITEIKKHQSDFSDLNEVEAEDCISRKAAIDGLGEQPYVWTDSDYEIQRLDDWESTKAMLESLPSVYPKSDKPSCNTCEHNDEQNGENCYECVKGIKNNYSKLDKLKRIEQIISDDWEKGFQHSETVARIKEVLNDTD